MSTSLRRPGSAGPGRMLPAFSLIELLVVIAIIAILVAIALPVIGKVRQAAVKSACASNLRQVGIGIESYRSEHDEVYPTARYMPAPFVSFVPGDPGLPELLDQQIPEDSEVYHCPGDDGYVHDLAGISYTYNASLGGRSDPSETWFGRFLDFNPSEIPMAYDVDGGEFFLQDGSSIEVPFFHLSRNLLFADGHVGEYQ